MKNKPIKVLIADDSAIMRRLVRETLESDPDLDVIGAVHNGRQAVEQFRKNKPDVVVLDIEMPEMDGVSATREIRKFDSKTPILIFSSLSTEGGKATLDALSAGANDCIAKPSSCGRLTLAIDQLKQELVPSIRNLSGLRHARPAHGLNISAQAESAESAERSIAHRPKPVTTPELVVIGVSTGGPAALGILLNRLPKTFHVPVVIVQHMPPKFTNLLAERLNKTSALEVAEATHGTIAKPGEAYVAPGSHHLRIAQSRGRLETHLDDGEPENSCRPAVDVLFRSAAMTCGDRVLGVVLTGMGKDGLAGARNIKDAGGFVIAQDECTSTIWGMPGEVVRAGLADKVLPLDQIADTLTQLVTPEKELVR